MSAVAIVRNLAANWAPLAAIVPASRILVGTIPQGTPLPAIGITEVYVREIQTTTRGAATKTSRARVQVTVLANWTADGTGYRNLKAALKAAALGPGVHTHLYTGAGFAYNVKSVIEDGIGPEIPVGDDKIYEQSRDFLVTFAEAN